MVFDAHAYCFPDLRGDGGFRRPRTVPPARAAVHRPARQAGPAQEKPRLSWLPPSVVDMSYPAARLVAEMDYAGVDRALLQTLSLMRGRL